MPDLDLFEAPSNAEIKPTSSADDLFPPQMHAEVAQSPVTQHFLSLKMRLLLTLTLAFVLGFAAAQDNQTSATNPLAVYPTCAVRTNS